MAMWTVSLFLGFFLATEGLVLGQKEPSSFSHKLCPGEWSAHGSRCFKFFKSPLQWIDAEFECLKHGANLASVHNNKENVFLKNLIKEATGSPTKYWLGGHDCVAEGKWVWSDGSKMSFQDWDKGQPDNYKNGEDCLEMNYGGSFKWNDALCTVLRPFVCALK
ncbi:galactose-specific lectin nattectin-like [Colossoma macropomum]|uniref:galactose-specific lectin nattectin-like n=1 Tax=Colossoma macropomum TaxID=42526 RepID=UPI001864C1FF|nr:galactose-specific lectin nattectin-like [Colossoma macropomum]